MFVPATGEPGDGCVCTGSFPNCDDPAPGVKFQTELQKKYYPGKWVGHIQYMGGMLEATVQTEALRLTLQRVPFEKLKRSDVLNHGFHQIRLRTLTPVV